MALCGGDPTVKRTALALAAVPAGNASITLQAPAGAKTKSWPDIRLHSQYPIWNISKLMLLY